jgi:serine/threonine protein phosphatase PrpC
MPCLPDSGLILGGPENADLSEAEIVTARLACGGQLCAATHPGFGYKERNEDRVALVEVDRGQGPETWAFVVDGMGGQSSGDVCAQLLSEELLLSASLPAPAVEAAQRELLAVTVFELLERLPGKRFSTAVASRVRGGMGLGSPSPTQEEIRDLAVDSIQIEATGDRVFRKDDLRRIAEVLQSFFHLKPPDRPEIAVRRAIQRLTALANEASSADCCFVGAVISPGRDGERILDVKQVGDCKLVVVDGQGVIRFETIGESLLPQPDLADPDIPLAELMMYSLNRNFVANSMRSRPLRLKRYRSDDVPVKLFPGYRVYLYSDGCDDLYTPQELVDLGRGRSPASHLRLILELAEKRMRFVDALIRAEMESGSQLVGKSPYPAIHGRMNRNRIAQGCYREEYPDGTDGCFVKPPKCDNLSFCTICIGEPGEQDAGKGVTDEP